MQRKLFLLILFLNFEKLFCNIIHEAAKRGDVETIEVCQDDVNEINECGDRPIHCAAKNLQLNAISALLRKGVSIDSTNTSGCTALHLIACLGEPKHVRFLLNRDANVNMQDGLNFSSPLHTAVFYNKYYILNELLNYKYRNPNLALNINVQDKFGRTALHLAVEKQHYQMCNDLLKAKIDPMLFDYNGKTALNLALELRENGYAMDHVINLINPYYLYHQNQYWLMQNFFAQQFDSKIQQVEQQNENNNQISIDLIPSEIEQQSVQENISQNQQQELQTIQSQLEIQETLNEPYEDVKRLPRAPKATHVSFLEEFKDQTFVFGGKKNEIIEKLKRKQIEPETLNLQKQESENNSLEILINDEPYNYELSQSELKENKVSKYQQKKLQKLAHKKTKPKSRPFKKSIINQRLIEKQQDNLQVNNIQVENEEEIQQDHFEPEIPQAPPITFSYKANLHKKLDKSLLEQIQEKIQTLRKTAPEKIKLKNKNDNTQLHVALERNKEINDDLFTNENVITANNEGNFALHYAAMYNNFSAIQRIINAGAEVDALNNMKYTPLHYAVNKNCSKIGPHVVNLLLSLGANVNLLNKKSQDKLTQFANTFDVEKFTYLKQFRTKDLQPKKQDNEQVKEVDESKKVEENQIEEKKENNTVVSIPKDPFNIFLENAKNGNCKKVKRALSQNSQWLTMRDSAGRIALHHAVLGVLAGYAKNLDTVKFLVDLNPQTMLFKEYVMGKTPVDLTLVYGNANTFKEFLNRFDSSLFINLKHALYSYMHYCKYHMSLDLNNKEYKNILLLLNKKSQEVKEQIINQYLHSGKEKLTRMLLFALDVYFKTKEPEIIQDIKFIMAGADLTYVNYHNQNFLHKLTELDIPELITELLLFKVIDIEAKDEWGNNALHYAAMKSLETLKIVYNAKPSLVNAVNNVGDTPLHLCTSKENAKFLIDVGADTQIKNKDKLTPFLIALKDKNEVVSLLWYHTFKILKIDVIKVIHNIMEVLVNDTKEKYYKLKDCYMYLMDCFPEIKEVSDPFLKLIER